MEKEFLTTDEVHWPFEMPIANDEILTEGQLPSEFSIGGWIYVMSNPSMPEIYKVGMTTCSPEKRAQELYSSSGVPTKFNVELAFYSSDPRKDEATVHRILAPYRVNESREFFKAPLEKIKWGCREAGMNYRENDISEIAVLTDVICTDTLKRLNVDEIFDSEGFCYFGDKNAVAEMLIRISARLMMKTPGYSFYINDGEVSLIEPADEQYFRSVENRPQAEIPNFIKELINGQSKKY